MRVHPREDNGMRTVGVRHPGGDRSCRTPASAIDIAVNGHWLGYTDDVAVSITVAGLLSVVDVTTTLHMPRCRGLSRVHVTIRHGDSIRGFH